MAVDLLDDQGHDQHHRGPYVAQRRHQRRGRGRTVEVGDPGAHREGVDHADRAFVGVRERQYGEEDVVGPHGEDRRREVDLRAERPVGQHHPFGARGRARGVDDDGQIVGLRLGRRALAAYALRDDAEVFRADHDVEALHGLLGEPREELVRDQQCFGFRVFDDHLQLLAREVGQNRHGDHACRRHGEVANAPVRRIAAQQRHLVARPQAGFEQRLLHFGDSATRLGVGHVFALVHREGDLRRELLHAVAYHRGECVECHVRNV